MKIKNFNRPKTSAALNESLKKKFGYTLNIKKMSLPMAKKAVITMQEGLTAFRKKVGEKANSSKVYAEKSLVIETLAQFIAEKEEAVNIERRRAKLKSKLNESEQAEAEVVLAAKDMVDSLQGMIEDLGAMQNEQLQPLVDSIRQTLGEETAGGFESSMTASLSSAMEAMRTARTDADSSARMLSGDEAATDDFMGDDEMDMGTGGPDMGADMEAPVAEPIAEPAPDAGLGRETREEDVELDLSGL